MIIGAIDIETTGLHYEKGDRITEVSLALVNTKNEQRQIYTRRVNPERNVSAESTRITGLTLDMLWSEPKWAEVGPELDRLLKRVDVLLAHNGVGFDLPFIKHEQETIGISNPISSATVDTMLQARWATPDGKLPSLNELAWSLGYDYDTNHAHAASYDADLTLSCYLEGWRRGFFTLPIERFEHE